MIGQCDFCRSVEALRTCAECARDGFENWLCDFCQREHMDDHDEDIGIFKEPKGEEQGMKSAIQRAEPVVDFILSGRWPRDHCIDRVVDALDAHAMERRSPEVSKLQDGIRAAIQRAHEGDTLTRHQLIEELEALLGGET